MGNTSNIREHMEVLGSCGNRVGAVDRIEGLSLKLTRNDPEARGEHHYIPLDWVASVDEAVHLNKPCDDVRQEWQAHPVREGEYMPEGK
jgi:hypothetical protein